MQEEEYFAAGVLIDDRYEILSTLGEGGMGVVYLANDTKLDRKVVIKFPKRDAVARRGFLDRFKIEMQSLLGFEHPNILRVYDAGLHEEMPFMVLAYMPAGSLEGRIREHGALSPDEVAAWLPRAARALDHLHRQGVIHRDIKPANILFDSFDQPMIADFGVVKILADMDETQGTPLGEVPGSAEAMAPEFLIGPISPQFDQFALAAAVYRSLTGARLYTTDSETEYLGNIVRESSKPHHLAELAPNVPADAAAAVMKALSHEAAGRFPSCAEFANAFVAGLKATKASQKVLEDIGPAKVEPPKEPLETPVPPSGLQPSGPRPAIWLAAMAAIAILSSVYYFTSQNPGEPDTTRPTLTLTGDNPLILTAGATYTEPGATANDNADGDVTNRIEVSYPDGYPLNPGQYSVAYSVTDSAGNETARTRTVSIEANTASDQADDTPPTLVMTGESVVILEAGTSYTELGATASDNVDGDLTDQVEIDYLLGYPSDPGTYVVNYVVTDSAGNEAIAVRTVHFNEEPASEDSDRSKEGAERNPVLAEIQRELKRIGFNPGPVDGVLGDRTVEAMDQLVGNYRLDRTGYEAIWAETSDDNQFIPDSFHTYPIINVLYYGNFHRILAWLRTVPQAALVSGEYLERVTFDSWSFDGKTLIANFEKHNDWNSYPIGENFDDVIVSTSRFQGIPAFYERVPEDRRGWSLPKWSMESVDFELYSEEATNFFKCRDKSQTSEDLYAVDGFLSGNTIFAAHIAGETALVAGLMSVDDFGGVPFVAAIDPKACDFLEMSAMGLRTD